MAKSKQGRSKTTSTGKTASQHPRKTDTSQSARGGLARPVTPSPELGAVVGSEPLSRAELTKRVWDYIKTHHLQDPQDRRQINADAQLQQVLGKERVSMFELTKLINQHVQ